jgi:hypothetical protein
MQNSTYFPLALMFASAAYAGTVKTGNTPTFNRDIAPILYQNCTSCHRAGEVAPFALMNYDDRSSRHAALEGHSRLRRVPG